MSWRRIVIYYISAALVGGALYMGQRMQAPSLPGDDTAPPIVEYLASRIDELALEGEGSETQANSRLSCQIRWMDGLDGIELIVAPEA